MCLRRLLAKRRPLVMGVLNVTPDSFSDGGRFLEPPAAIAQARRLVAEGADIIDIGAESTRPYGGAVGVSADEERARLEPVLPEVIALGIPVSIDTMKADDRRLGARRSARRSSTTCGACSATPIWRASSPNAACRSSSCTIARPPIAAIDIIADVTAFFARSLDIAARAGHRARADRARSRHRLRQDAGAEHDLHRPASTPGAASACRCWSAPRASASSIRSRPSEPAERLGGSLAAHLLAVENGAAIVRVHDVAPTVQALAVAAAIRQAR